MPLRDRPHERQPEAHAADALAGAGPAIEPIKDAIALIELHDVHHHWLAVFRRQQLGACARGH